MNKPREHELLVETEEHKAWAASGGYLRGKLPHDMKTHDKVRMIEYSAYHNLQHDLSRCEEFLAMAEKERDEARSVVVPESTVDTSAIQEQLARANARIDELIIELKQETGWHQEIIKERNEAQAQFEHTSIAAGEYSLQLEKAEKERDEALAVHSGCVALVIELDAERAKTAELTERLQTVNDTNKLKQMTIHEVQQQRDEAKAAAKQEWEHGVDLKIKLSNAQSDVVMLTEQLAKAQITIAETLATPPKPKSWWR